MATIILLTLSVIHARAVWDDGQALKRGPIPVEHFSVGVSRVEVCRNYQGGGALDENDLNMQIPRDTHAAVCLKHKSSSAVVHEGKVGSNPGQWPCFLCSGRQGAASQL